MGGWQLVPPSTSLVPPYLGLRSRSRLRFAQARGVLAKYVTCL